MWNYKDNQGVVEKCAFMAMITRWTILVCFSSLIFLTDWQYCRKLSGWIYEFNNCGHFL